MLPQTFGLALRARVASLVHDVARMTAMSTIGSAASATALYLVTACALGFLAHKIERLKVPGLRFSNDPKLLIGNSLRDADFGVGSVRLLFGPIS